MLIYELNGTPVAQKQTQWTKKGFVYDPSRKDKEEIQWQIKPYLPNDPLTGPIEMHLHFFLPMQKYLSAPKRRQMINQVILPVTRPDVDNLAYLVTNALKGLVYVDDSQITDLILRKRYAERPRTIIKVIPIQQAEHIGAVECV